MQKKASNPDAKDFHTSPQKLTYLPIEDYAIIGDCRSAALISRNGSIDWLCFPHFSGASLFAALLDPERGGRFAISPSGEFQVQRRYVDETNVLETTFKTHTGIARLTDCMALPVESEAHTHLLPQREVLRILEVVEGEVDLEVTYEPRPDFGRAKTRLRRYGRLGWGCSFRDELFMLHANIPFECDSEGKTLSTCLRLSSGEKRHLSLTYTKRDIAVIMPLGKDADNRVSDTLQWWKAWSKQLRYDGPYRDMVLRSVLTLKLMTYSLSGAVVAAPTASLPEKIGGVRNWDYRYCWLRDASLTLAAFNDLGFRSENEEFLAWLLHATRLSWPKLQVLYDVYGETELTETTLDHFNGYRNSRPVRVGNAAHAQTQLDVYGEVILAVYDAVQHGLRLDVMATRMLVGLGRTICKQWRQPDQGIWEARDEGLHNTYSKAMCWVGLDCLLRLAEQGHIRVPAQRFQDEREAIRDAVETQGFNKTKGSYDTAFGVDEVDASLLLLARCGYIDANHPRMTGTYERIERELGENGFIYRFRAGFDDFLPPGEGAFGIASFWAIDYLALRGDIDKATQRLDTLLKYANDLGLYAEEIDPKTGVALGNFPQAFTHVGLINAALSLQNAEKRQMKQR